MNTSKTIITTYAILAMVDGTKILNLSHAAENTPPSPPTVFAVIPGDDQVTLRWNDSPEATGYDVRARGFAAENVQSNEIIHDTARNDASRRYTVSSINAFGESETTQPVICKPTAPVLDWIPAGARLELLADGMQFTEGPVWIPVDDGYLVFSDIDGNRLYRWDFENGLSLFREPSHNANGNTIDLEGRLLTCEHANRYISITQHDGTVEPLIQHFEGKRFNSPNDVVVKSDGTIHSSALADNLIDSPSERELVVVLPPSYQAPAGGDKRYPVIYGLHGFWNSRIDQTLKNESEARWKKRGMGEAILVFMDANNRYGGSFYGSSPVIGDYETYITEEIVDYIDEHYRTIQDRSSRALVGFSMGGFGAVRLGLRNHERFGVVAACSGLYDFSSDWYANSISRAIAGFNGTWTQYEKLSLNEQASMAIAAAASPNPDIPPFFTDRVWYMDGRRPTQNPGTLDLHIQFDAMRAVNVYKESNPNPISIGIIHGKSDGIVPISQAQTLHALLLENETMGITSSYAEVDDGHNFRHNEVLDLLERELSGLELLLAQPVLALSRQEDHLEISFATQSEIEYVLQVAESPATTSEKESWTDVTTVSGNDNTAVIQYPMSLETKQTYFRVVANPLNL